MLNTAEKIKLKVLPLLNTAEHLAYYEGPCRFGQGETLMPGYDRLANAQKSEAYLKNLAACLPEGVELMDLSFHYCVQKSVLIFATPLLPCK